jgi:hypothetical protein
MAAVVALGFAVSAEQGAGLMVGLCAYALVLAWHDRTVFPYGAALLAVCSTALVYVVVSRAGMLITAHHFAQGGLNFPLLPSPNNLFVLAVYVCGLGLFLRTFLAGEMNNVVVPLGLCGVPMLVSAMGRCDPGHLMSATPLTMVGIFALAGRPRLFWLWLFAGCYFFIDWSHPVRFAMEHVRPHPVVAVAHAPAARAVRQESGTPIDSGRTYYAPAMLPVRDGQLLWNAQSGYYFGMENAAGAEDIEAKRVEIVERRSPYLVLPDVADPIRYTMMDTTLDRMPGARWARRWNLRERHAMPSTAPILQAIQAMYVPTHEAQDGWRVWRLR